MTRPRWSLGVALVAGLALLGNASPLVAADPASTLPAATDLTSGDTALAGVGESFASLAGGLGDLGDSLLGGLGQTLDAAVASSTSNPCSGSGSLKKSANGSVTVLLLGSDYRRSPYIGERTDTVIALNIARNGRVAMAAIPRDTVRIPLAGGGTSGSRRVNALYIGYKRSSVGRAGVDCSALDHVRRDIARALGTSIPYYALIRMDQFQLLIDRIGGLSMNIRGELIDYHYSRNDRKIWVPRVNGYQMNGGGDCGKKPKRCRNALRYARSRYGTEGGAANSDFRRVRRQQEIVFYAVRKVLARGNGSNLSSLLGAVKGRIYSNLPKTWSGALALYSAAKGATFAENDGKVFGPSRWASSVSRYTYQLKLGDVRQWIDNHFKP
jgi:anionic cell wall polymer biosynthesis LytR-Cps2A-Psr (LCP) family protein